MLKSIKEQLRQSPFGKHRGIGYGLLRYLSPDKTVRQQLERLPRPQVAFNYLGQFDRMLSPTPCSPWPRSPPGRPRALGASALTCWASTAW